MSEAMLSWLGFPEDRPVSPTLATTFVGLSGKTAVRARRAISPATAPPRYRVDLAALPHDENRSDVRVSHFCRVNASVNIRYVNQQLDNVVLVRRPTQH